MRNFQEHFFYRTPSVDSLRCRADWPLENTSEDIQNQSSVAVLMKRCSKNMLQIYRRTHIPKCDFNKVVKQHCWNHTSTWMFSCKFGCTFSEHLFVRTPMDGCFWTSSFTCLFAVKFVKFLGNFLTVCSYRVTYAFQSEFTPYSCLSVKELLVQNRHHIWSLNDSNGTWTNNHLVCKRTLNHLTKLAIRHIFSKASNRILW